MIDLKHGIVAGEATNALIGTVVGAVRLHESVEYVDRSYECAAWWEARRSGTGIFPLVLRKRYHAPHTLYLSATLPAVVTDDHFPALWGGVAVSNRPYEPKNVGASRTIDLSIDVLQALEMTGWSPNAQRDVYLDPEVWPLLLREIDACMTAAHARLPEAWDRYASGEDEYQSRASMVGHYAEIIGEMARASQLVRRELGYEREDGHLKRCREANTAWAREFLTARAA